MDSSCLDAGLNGLFFAVFFVCKRHMLSKILTNASYIFILEKNKQAEIRRKNVTVFQRCHLLYDPYEGV